MVSPIFIIVLVAYPWGSIQCGSKPKQSEAQTYVGSLNKGQQIYFAEKKRFANNIDGLEIGIRAETDQYSCKMGVFEEKRLVQTIGIAKKDGLKSYTGLVARFKVKNTVDKASFAILCVSDAPSKEISPSPTVSGEYYSGEYYDEKTSLKCLAGYSPVGN